MTDEKELVIKSEQIERVELGGEALNVYGLETPFGMAHASIAYKDLPQVVTIEGTLRIQLKRKENGLIEHILVESIKPLPGATIQPSAFPSPAWSNGVAVDPTPIGTKVPATNTNLKSHGEKWLTQLIQSNESFFRAKFNGNWFTVHAFLSYFIHEAGPFRKHLYNTDLEPYENGLPKLYNVAGKVLNALTNTPLLEREKGHPSKYRFTPTQSGTGKGDPHLKDSFKALQDTVH